VILDRSDFGGNPDFVAAKINDAIFWSGATTAMAYAQFAAIVTTCPFLFVAQKSFFRLFAFAQLVKRRNGLPPATGRRGFVCFNWHGYSIADCRLQIADCGDILRRPEIRNLKSEIA